MVGRMPTGLAVALFAQSAGFLAALGIFRCPFLSNQCLGPIFRLASDLDTVPKRSELARSAVGADSYLQVGALARFAAIALIAGSILQ